MHKQRGNATLGALIVIALWVGAAGGYIANIVKFIGILNEPITGMFIARIVGIFALPLGAVLGFF